MARMARLVTCAALAGLTPAQTPIATVEVTAGLDRPVWIGTPPGDFGRLFVAEQQTGRLRIVKGTTLLAPPFLDLGGQIAIGGGEQGLLGVAFHPRYAANGLFYVNYTRRSDNATVVASYRVSPSDPDLADPASATQLLVIGKPQVYHNAGCMHFGADGYLYIAVGDGGAGNCASQRGDTLLGKILRIDVDNGTPYAIPPSNPFVADPNVLDEIWTLGWRNPWRFCFDRVTGDMLVGDVGWMTKEEVSFQPGHSPGGTNYGWPVMEGTVCYQTTCAAPPCNDPRLQLPLLDYANERNPANCCVIGGHVYRGCAIPDLQGHYFFGDLCSTRFWSFRVVNQQVVQFQERTSELNPLGPNHFFGITTFGEDAAGEIYCTGLHGRIYKIVPRAAAPAVNLGFGKVGSNGLVPAFTACGILSPGLYADFTLRQAPANAPAALLLSTQLQPVVLPWATLAPIPVQASVGFLTDPSGAVGFRASGAAGPASAYAQFVVLDVAVSGGLGVSNALRVDLP